MLIKYLVYFFVLISLSQPVFAETISDYTYQVEITINNTNSTENLVGFPVLCYLDNTRINFSHVRPNGVDIRFVDEDVFTFLSYEIEHWNDTSEKAWIWVNVTQLDSEDVIEKIYLIYGNATVSDGQDVAGTWNDNYEAVYHFAENVSDASGAVLDSTYNGHNGTIDSTNNPLWQESSGKALYGSYNFSTDKITIGDFYIPHVTASALIYTTSTAQAGVVGQFNGGNGLRAWGLFRDTQGNDDVTGWIYTASATYKLGYTGTEAIDIWQWTDFSWDGSNIKVMLNGTEKSITQSGTSSGNILNIAQPVYIGYMYDGVDRYFSDIIDEVRISKVARSSEWREAEWLSVEDMLCSYGMESYTADVYKISGYVDNTDLNMLSSVDVSTNTSKTTTTNSTGYYEFTDIINGTYNLTFSKSEYVTGYLEVIISGSDNTTVNKTLTSGIYSGNVTYTLENDLNISRVREPFYWNITGLAFATNTPEDEILINDTSDNSIIPFDIIDHGTNWAYIVFTESFNSYETKTYNVRFNNPGPMIVDYTALTGWNTDIGAVREAWSGVSFWTNNNGLSTDAWHINTTSNEGVNAYLCDGGSLSYYQAKPMSPFRRDFANVYNTTDNSSFNNIFENYGNFEDAIGVLEFDGRVMKELRSSRFGGWNNTFRFFYNSDYVEQNVSQPIPPAQNDRYGLRYSCVGVDGSTTYADGWMVNATDWTVFNPGGIVISVPTMSEPWMAFRGHDTYVPHDLLMVTVWNSTSISGGLLPEAQSQKDCSGDQNFHIGILPPPEYALYNQTNIRFIDLNITENKENSRAEWLKFNSQITIQTSDAEDATPPASIIDLTNTTGNFWHNWTWTNPTDSDFNHTMIYLNNVFITNVSNTTTFYNYTVSPHNVSTISTHTVDITGNINSTWVNHTSVIGNNPITLSDGGSYDTWNESENVYVSLAYSDADSDSPVVYATNRTDLFTDFHSPTGSGHWQTDYTDTGVYHIGFNVSDGYGSIGDLTFVLTINNVILPPQNLTNVTDLDRIHFNWDDDVDADYWNVSQLDVTIPFTSTYAVLDGIKDACYAYWCAYGFVGDAPNPFTDYGKELIYILRNDTYLILYADGEDNDNFNNDDNFIIGIDASNNNLTTDDRKFILNEGGTVTAKRWSGSAWNPIATNAQGVVVGGGTAGAIQYEMFIPVSELDTNFTNGSTVKFFMSRTHTASNPDVESYYPQTLINTTDATLWQSVLLSSEAQYTYINNTTTSSYTVTGLDPFTWYQHRFTTINGSQESSGINSADITLDTPSYTISGYIKDISGNPIVNADVWGENGYPLKHNVSNASGHYIGPHFHNGTYTIYANATGYSQNNSGVVTVAGANLTNVNITLISSNYDNFTFTNAQVSPSAIFEGKPFTVSVDINDTDGAIATAIVKIDGTNYTMTNSTGDTWTYIFSDTAIPTRYFVQNFYAQDNTSAWNSTTSTLSVMALPTTGTGGFGGIPTDIPEPAPEEEPPEEEPPEEELIPEEPTDISSIFDVLEEKLSEVTNITTIKNIFKSKAVAFIGVKYMVGDYSTTKDIIKPEALTCESTDPRVSCGVMDGVVTIIVMPTTDDSKLYQFTDTYVKITNNDLNVYHLPVSLSLINLMWYFGFNMDIGIENPYIVAGGINTDATVGLRGWWITAIAGLAILGFMRKYN